MKPEDHHPNRARATEIVHRRLGYTPPNLAWAKLEILLGLGAASIAILLEPGSIPGVEFWQIAISKWLLIVLGIYLALAGHRSHIYRSINESTALILTELRPSPTAPGDTDMKH